ncbi:MAG: cytochrome C, partial [Gammaproteobacteria bacterium]|nr:cytochrome C [Gammaproteobacteria bacterium]
DLIYFIGWPDTGAIMRRLDDGTNTKDGKAGNMYQYLGSTDAERKRNFALFKSWVGDDAWRLNRWKARGDVPGITKEQLNQIKVKY